MFQAELWAQEAGVLRTFLPLPPPPPRSGQGPLTETRAHGPGPPWLACTEPPEPATGLTLSKRSPAAQTFTQPLATSAQHWGSPCPSPRGPTDGQNAESGGQTLWAQTHQGPNASLLLASRDLGKSLTP